MTVNKQDCGCEHWQPVPGLYAAFLHCEPPGHILFFQCKPSSSFCEFLSAADGGRSDLVRKKKKKKEKKKSRSTVQDWKGFCFEGFCLFFFRHVLTMIKFKNKKTTKKKRREKRPKRNGKSWHRFRCQTVKL